MRAWPTVGSTSPPVTRAACSAAWIASVSRGRTATHRPAAALSKDSSESSRKREAAWSKSATTRSTAIRAVARRAGSATATTPRPPKTGKLTLSGKAQEPPETTAPPPLLLGAGAGAGGGGGVDAGGGELWDPCPDPEIPSWAALAGGARGGADCADAFLDRRAEPVPEEVETAVPVARSRDDAPSDLPGRRAEASPVSAAD